jgi:hypothetical protein
MIATTAKLISGFILVVAVSACATNSGLNDEAALAAAGAIRLNGSEVKARLIGKTEEWLRGGAYYQADGKIKVKWRKTVSNGSWQVSANGELCFELPHWKKQCHFYMKKDDDVYMLESDENDGVRKMFDGDKLNSLGSFNAG